MVFVIHWAHILSVFRITHSQKHKYPSVEELMCAHNTHTLIITLLVFHRHLEKHKEGDLNPNPEMIFPPVTITTKFVCKFLLYMCACLCWRPHAKVSTGDIQRFLGGGPRVMITFPAVLSQRHNYTKSKVFVETWRQRIRQKQRKWQKQIRSNSSLTTALLCFIFIRLTPVLKNHFATDSIHNSFLSSYMLESVSLLNLSSLLHLILAVLPERNILCCCVWKQRNVSKHLNIYSIFFFTACRVRSSTPKFLVWSALRPLAFYKKILWSSPK